MTWPKISIVTPSFNQERFLEETILSIHRQNYPGLEHIIIDGGSNDESVEIIQKYASRLAYWVSEPDGGQTDALIKGFSKASGEILAWLNSDDLYEPHTLWEVADWFRNHPEDEFIYGDALWIDIQGRPIKPKKEIPFNWFIWLYDYNYIPQPSAFWRRGLYERVGGLDRSFDLAMDADLWARFAEVCFPKHVRRIWSRMRFYPEQKNQRLREKSNEEDRIIRQRYVRRNPPTARCIKRVAAKLLRIGWKLCTGSF
ncbi:glycosyltransferase [Anaerolinea thermolimosa]|uniref:glycosyltransferase family 2 protein n=1 Tax=Anaerolinea thermolimosa TaxID=229919 RepID=UPI0007864EF8|nr:glycosyltransferase family 2 protein [Anaerolinea thermolimosa]GAP07773.1 glycosyltransferase [Anaerolinea thermolimosa]